MAADSTKRMFLLAIAWFLLAPAVSPSSASVLPASTGTPARAPHSETLIVRVYFKDRSTVNRLAANLDVWEVNQAEGYLVAAVTSDQVGWLRQQGFTVVVDDTKTTALNRPPATISGQASGISGFPCYRTVEETYSDLSQLAAAHPELAEWIDIGDSWQKTTGAGQVGYDIHSLVLSNRAAQVPAAKPRFFLMGAIHAREYATAELAARFAEHLIYNYGTDPDITWLLDHFELHIVPVANPDGRKLAEQYESRFQRKNTNDSNGGSCAVPPQPADQYGTDLNRNHSFNWGGASPAACSETYQGPSAASEPETLAIEAYLKSIFPDQRGEGEQDPAPLSSSGLLISLHSFGELVLWPWGWTDFPAPNDSELEVLGAKLAFFNAYHPQQSSQLYATTGDSADFAYGELGVPAYTFELGKDFFQDCETFEAVILPDNLTALLYAFKAARLPYQNPSGPDSLDLAVNPAINLPGGTVTVTFVADDTRRTGAASAETISAARYSIDAPSWVDGSAVLPLDAADGSFDSSSEVLQTAIETTGWAEGLHMIFVESQDSAGNWGIPSAAFIWNGANKAALYLPLVGKQ